MGLFAWSDDPQLPDVPEDVAPKTGFALFMDILRREAWELMELNLLFVLLCLPVVTIPAAHAAAVHILVAKVQDRNVYLLRDFRDAFVANFWRASLAGWVLAAVIGLASYAVYIYAQAMAINPWFAIPLLVSAAGVLVLILIGLFLFPMLVLTKLPLATLARNALLLALSNLPYGFLVVSICAAIWLAFVASYPLSILMPAVFNFSFCALVATFYAMGPIAKHVTRISR
jgi:uncharacterized membrane protein YesL